MAALFTDASRGWRVSAWPPERKNHADMGELVGRRRAEFHADAHGSAVEKKQDWASAQEVGESLEKLEHGEHVAPVVWAGCEKPRRR